MCVLGRALALLTVVKRPVFALLPIFITSSILKAVSVTAPARRLERSLKLFRDQDRPCLEPKGSGVENLSGTRVNSFGPEDQPVARRNVDTSRHFRLPFASGARNTLTSSTFCASKMGIPCDCRTWFSASAGKPRYPVTNLEPPPNRGGFLLSATPHLARLRSLNSAA